MSKKIGLIFSSETVAQRNKYQSKCSKPFVSRFKMRYSKYFFESYYWRYGKIQFFEVKSKFLQKYENLKTDI